MKSKFTKTLLLALCFLSTSQSALAKGKKFKAKEIVEFLEKAFKEDGGYIEDNLAYIKEHGHDNLAEFLEELRDGYKTTCLSLEAFALYLVAKHKISLTVANKVRLLMNKYKGKDYIWQNALERTRPAEETVVITSHEEDDFKYNDAEGREHEVHVESDIRIEDTVKAAQAATAAQKKEKNRG